MKLSDEVISHIARTLQIAILTGTDIIDNLRMIKLQLNEDDDTLLFLEDEYKSICEDNIDKMLAQLESITTQETETEDN